MLNFAVTLIVVCTAVLFAGAMRSASASPEALQSRQLRGSARLSLMEVILPARLVAGAPATLATVGADHRLVGHVPVDLGNGIVIETDATGRANFTAPRAAVLIAKAGGGSAATLIDTSANASAGRQARAPRFAALHNSFDVCGGGFDGNAEANHVAIDSKPALVLASSPECLVVIPDANAEPGVAQISIESAAPPREVSVTLVALDFSAPNPPLTPGEKGWLTVRARGSSQRLRVTVQNESPGVLQFDKGDAQELTTSGGSPNVARIRVQAVRSGDFSFSARIAQPPDARAAGRLLQAAEPLAPPDVAHRLRTMERDLAHHPKSPAKVRLDLDRILAATNPRDLRALLEAAGSSL